MSNKSYEGQNQMSEAIGKKFNEIIPSPTEASQFVDLLYEFCKSHGVDASIGYLTTDDYFVFDIHTYRSRSVWMNIRAKNQVKPQ